MDKFMWLRIYFLLVALPIMAAIYIVSQAPR